MKFHFSLNERSIFRHLDDLVQTLDRKLYESAAKIREIVVKNVLDNKNWSDEARYSPKSPMAGSKFDLAFSGQLRTAIAAPENNVITRGRKRAFEIGIGNIAVLDSLRSQSSNSSVPYWRYVVFGHRAPWRKGPHTFVPTGTVGDKNYGVVIPVKDQASNMRGTQPTMMFDNGYFVSRRDINRIISKAIDDALREVRGRWK